MEKYYTPKIEEFHVGFEYEIFEDFDSLPEKSWHKFIDGNPGTGFEDMAHPRESDNCRVKYLDYEDITSLGWQIENAPLATKDHPVYQRGEGGFNRYRITDSNKFIYYMQHYTSEDRVIISSIKIIGTLFHGIIKNKSEFKKILVQIGII